MKNIFLDTSSIVKVYHKENDSEKILKILSYNTEKIFLSEITKIEFISALWRKARMQEANEMEVKSVIRFFETDYSKYNWVILDSEIINSAKNLLNKYGKSGLKTLDSIQLSCAVSLKNIASEFHTSDKLLKNIFINEGLNAL
ncbi:MAG: hypothetical protein COZ59_13875 [Bacteroidetes bacterium CG_4_8_14_3_um_filter_31_14]|nr:MAG: hypothetical protein COZ59_13875 [Bacteroidetes bacterium CG_4_8_14_3_um_filter_31_14]